MSVHVCRIECGTVHAQTRCGHPPPHTSFTHAHSLLTHSTQTHMHTSLQEDRCRPLPQPKAVHTERVEGKGEGDEEEHLLNKMADQWMSTRDLMKVHTCIHTVLTPKDVSSCNTCCVTGYFCLLVSVFLYHIRMHVCCVHVSACVHVCMRACVRACV